MVGLRTLLPLALLATLPTQLDGQVVAVRSPTAPEPTHLVVGQELRQELGRLAETSQSETVRCLMGVVRGDTAIVETAWTPAIHGSTPSMVSYDGCPAATLAEWHNHPWTAELRPEGACYLSRADIASALRPGAPPVQIVQVTAEVSCWWLQAEIARGRERAILWPAPGHLMAVAGPPTGAAAAHSMERF